MEILTHSCMIVGICCLRGSPLTSTPALQLLAGTSFAALSLTFFAFFAFSALSSLETTTLDRARSEPRAAGILFFLDSADDTGLDTLSGLTDLAGDELPCVPSEVVFDCGGEIAAESCASRTSTIGDTDGCSCKLWTSCGTDNCSAGMHAGIRPDDCSVVVSADFDNANASFARWTDLSMEGCSSDTGVCSEEIFLSLGTEDCACGPVGWSDEPCADRDTENGCVQLWTE